MSLISGNDSFNGNRHIFKFNVFYAFIQGDSVYSVSEDNPRIFSSVSGILNKQNLVLPKVNNVNRGIEISKTERYFHR